MFLVRVHAPGQHEAGSVLVAFLEIAHRVVDPLGELAILLVSVGVVVPGAVVLRLGICRIGHCRQLRIRPDAWKRGQAFASDVFRAPFFNFAGVSFGYISTMDLLLLICPSTSTNRRCGWATFFFPPDVSVRPR